MEIPNYALFSSFEILMAVIDAISALVITGLSLSQVNDMTPETSLIRRLSQVILCCGGVALLIAPFFGRFPAPWPQTVAHVGVALLMIENFKISKLLVRQ